MGNPSGARKVEARKVEDREKGADSSDVVGKQLGSRCARTCSCFYVAGIDALPCEVEVHLSPHGLPQICVVGLPDAAIRESVERVRRAIEVSGFEVPRHHVLVNLAPAGTRKEGPVYDLPIAMGLLFAAGTAEPKRGDAPSPADWLIAGELALDGRLRPIRGSVSAALMARDHNRGVIVPIENAIEASLVPGVKVIGASTLCEVVAFFGARVLHLRRLCSQINRSMQICQTNTNFQRLDSRL